MAVVPLLIPRFKLVRMKTGGGLSLKYVSLCVLCVQNSTLALLMRLSRVGDGPKYNPSTAVFLGEVLKLITCVLWLLKVRPSVPRLAVLRPKPHSLPLSLSLSLSL